MTTGLKPSWQGLKTSTNFSNPVEEVVGQIVDWRLDLDSFNNTQIVFRFASCQILNSDVPFPYPDWEMSIKFSEHETSSWGFFGISAATALGTDIELLDIDLLKGRWAHILRSNHDYGPNKDKPEISPGVPARMMGIVYRIVRFIQPGEVVTSIAPPKMQPVLAAPIAQVAQPAATPIVMPAAQVIPQTVVAPAVQQPLTPNGPVPTPVVQVAGMAAVTPAAVIDVTPEDQALLLLHGKDTASFFAAAIPDPIVRKNPELVNAIMSGVFIQTKIASAQVTLNDNGTHSVVGMG